MGFNVYIYSAKTYADGSFGDIKFYSMLKQLPKTAGKLIFAKAENKAEAIDIFKRGREISLTLARKLLQHNENQAHLWHPTKRFR